MFSYAPENISIFKEIFKAGLALKIVAPSPIID